MPGSHLLESTGGIRIPACGIQRISPPLPYCVSDFFQLSPGHAPQWRIHQTPRKQVLPCLIQQFLDTFDTWRQLKAAMETMEQGLEIQGVTAIEDKLQDGVPDALNCLRKAGTKVRSI